MTACGGVDYINMSQCMFRLRAIEIRKLLVGLHKRRRIFLSYELLSAYEKRFAVWT
jgi:hypothetical protein